MIPYTIINKKEQAKKIILGLYDPLYYNKLKSNKHKNHPRFIRYLSL